MVRLDKLRLEGIYKNYENTVILKDVSFSLAEKEIKVILGASGSGKTSILNVIAGILSPDKGKVIKDGRDITSDDIKDRKVGFVFQDLGLFYSMNVAENIAYGLRIKNESISEINERVRNISEIFAIRDHLSKFPSQLSGGEKQLVALARTLVTGPDLLLMDEPLSSLDSFLRNNVRWYIKDVPEKFGVSVIYVTHDLADAEILGDSIAILDEGRILQDGPKEEVMSRPRNKTIARIMGYNIFEMNGEIFAIRPDKFIAGGDVEFKVIHRERGFNNNYLVETEYGKFHVVLSSELIEKQGISLRNAIPLKNE